MAIIRQPQTRKVDPQITASSPPALPARWSTHGEVGGLLFTVKYLETAKPRILLVENAVGFQRANEGDSHSGLEYLTQKAVALGYSSAALEMDLSWVHGVVRNRLCLPY